MPELLRTFVGRLREFAGDRRHMPRRRVRLEFTVVPETPNKANGRRPQSLRGYTRDISVNGLGLIVPAIRIADRYLAGENCQLGVTLELPTGSVHIRAVSARYEPLENEDDQGYLIGARIIEMSDEHRKLFTTALKNR